jgi:myo-inositol-1-phosphate synthase
MKKIKIAIAGIGNCASSLLQGIEYYKDFNEDDALGLMHWDIGGFKPYDIEVVEAFDIDKRKVGKDVSEAIFELPNCTTVFCEKLPITGVTVKMGKILDGFSQHMRDYKDEWTFIPADLPQPEMEDVVTALKNSGAEILLNYLPVGSENAVKFYAECALKAGIGFINNMPVFIASNPEWAERFKRKGLPIIGDDIKAQLGATITHRALANLFRKRGVKLDRTYQLNTGGNTDFLNMLNRDRLASKKKSKTEAVQSVLGERLDPENIHVGPSDYVPWQKDNKVCFIRMEGRMFGDVPMNLELRLSVEDSPNSAGVAIDAIRCCKLGLERGIGGILFSPSAYFMKHPPKQFTDDEAFRMTNEFITRAGRRSNRMKCLIIAAGKGSRLAEVGDSKPLISLLGFKLIERVILTGRRAGINDFYVVIGYNGDKVKEALEAFKSEWDVNITYIQNDEWEKQNGISVLKAKEFIDENFILSMADHIYDADILRRLMHEKIEDGEVILAIDYNIESNTLVDIDDVTRVKTKDGKIIDIGKNIEDYNAYDTGIFYCTPAIFNAIERSANERDDNSLSGGMRMLAEANKARTFDIEGGFWIDVDDEKALRKAERRLRQDHI